MIKKSINFTIIQFMVTRIRSPDRGGAFVEEINYSIPRKLSQGAAVRHAKKLYPDMIRSSIVIQYEQRIYTISIDDFIAASCRIK